MLEPLLVLAGTVAGCWMLHAAIRRVGLLRPCFGMKPMQREASAGSATPAAA